MNNYRQGKEQYRKRNPKSVSGFQRRFLALAVPDIATEKPVADQPTVTGRIVRSEPIGTFFHQLPKAARYAGLYGMDFARLESRVMGIDLAEAQDFATVALIDPDNAMSFLDRLLAGSPMEQAQNFIRTLDPANYELRMQPYITKAAAEAGMTFHKRLHVFHYTDAGLLERVEKRAIFLCKSGGREVGETIRRPRRTVAGIAVIDRISPSGDIDRKPLEKE